MRPVAPALLAALLLLPGCSTGDEMTLLDARDQIRAVVGDLAAEVGGTVTVTDEYVTAASDTQDLDADEVVYSLSLDVDATPEQAREAMTDDVVTRYRDAGWTVERDPFPEVPLRLTRDGALVAVDAGDLRQGALVVGTSGPVPTPEDVRPMSARLPFDAYEPTS